MKLMSETPYGIDDASYLAAGKYAGIEQLVNCFYDYMETLPVATTILRMHPPDLTESREKLIRFLCGWLGGPKLYNEKYGPIRIPMAHLHLHVTEAERDAWLLCMQKAVDDQDFDASFKTYFMQQIFIPAERVRQVGTARRTRPDS